MTLEETLGALERELAGGDGDTYRRLLTDDAVVIVPGTRLSKEECAAAVDASLGWDAITFAQRQVISIDDATALVTYRFDGTRGDIRYSALAASLYVRREGAWRMALHQQTPLPQ